MHAALVDPVSCDRNLPDSIAPARSDSCTIILADVSSPGNQSPEERLTRSKKVAAAGAGSPELGQQLTSTLISPPCYPIGAPACCAHPEARGVLLRADVLELARKVAAARRAKGDSRRAGNLLPAVVAFRDSLLLLGATTSDQQAQTLLASSHRGPDGAR